MPIYTPPGLEPPIPLADIESIADGTYLGRAVGAGSGPPVAVAGPGGMITQWMASILASTLADRFMNAGSQSASASIGEDFSKVLIPMAITVYAISAYLATAFLAATVTFTLRKNGVDTSLVVALTAGQTANTATGSVSVAAGDILSVKVVESIAESGGGVAVRASVAWRG